MPVVVWEMSCSLDLPVVSQWFLNLLPKEARVASSADQTWFGERFKNHRLLARLDMPVVVWETSCCLKYSQTGMTI